MREVFGYFSPWSSQHSSVSIVTSLKGCKTAQFWFDSRQDQETFLCLKTYRPALGFKLLLSVVNRDCSWEHSSQGREANHLFSSKFEVKNKWTYSSTSVCIRNLKTNKER
jgi:hypothetical protein